jgi:N-methylhydantoinase B/oxoprolinase/acetone carboxylase alpha subunit
MEYDPVTLEVFRNLFHSVAEEMGVTLMRTAYSPNIKERRDYSCALFDANGKMVAQGDHMPVHLGSMPLSVENALENFNMVPGDVVALNDPYRGGTHLPDFTMVSPVFSEDASEPSFFMANRAHHADVGGTSPGSMPIASEIFQEGIIVPPVRLVRKGVVAEDVMNLILSNVRTPEERHGDFAAQIASLKTGERRLEELMERYGGVKVMKYARGLQEYTERVMRTVFEEIPDGNYSFSDFLDDDGMASGPVEIKVQIAVEGDGVIVDFTGTDPQVQGNINANYAITLSAVFYVFRCLLPYRIPSNSGCLAPIEVLAPEGCVVNATFPSAVAAGNVETSQRIVDALFGALSKAIPDRVPAASSGTMNNLTIGGVYPGDGGNYAYYETVAGGMGARPGSDGLDAVHTHMTNTMNTPVEALERYFPFRVIRYEIRRGTGGRGRYRGGDGIRRDLRMMEDSVVTVISDRRRFSPYGLHGGEKGRQGENVLIRADGTEEVLPGKVQTRLKAGDTLSIRSPGGGGFGANKPEKSE